jgi:hypothetical protein
MAKKKAPKRPWLLANNPDDNNVCQCFHRNVPNNQWIVVSRFTDEKSCRTMVNNCTVFFMKQPLKYRHARKMGMMG